MQQARTHRVGVRFDDAVEALHGRADLSAAKCANIVSRRFGFITDRSAANQRNRQGKKYALHRGSKGRIDLALCLGRRRAVTATWLARLRVEHAGASSPSD